MNYLGGTYVSQVKSHDPVEAKIKWIERLNFKEIGGVPTNEEETKKLLLSKSKEESFEPVKLEELESVWQTEIWLGDAFGRVAIVATVPDWTKVSNSQN